MGGSRTGVGSRMNIWWIKISMKIQTNELKCILEIIGLDSRKVKNESVSCSVVSDSVTPWAAVCWAPMSMEFSRQEYWSGLPFPSPGGIFLTQGQPRDWIWVSCIARGRYYDYHGGEFAGVKVKSWEIICLLSSYFFPVVVLHGQPLKVKREVVG